MITTIRRYLVVAERADRGFSLPELLVTLFLTSVVGTIAVSFYVIFTNTFTEERAATDSTTTAALGMNDLTRVIRAGTEIPVQGQTLNNPVFVAARNEEVILHAFIDADSANPAPIRVRFWINSDRELIETRYNAYVINGSYWAFNTTVASERIISSRLPVRQSGDPWLFTYLTENGAAMTVPVSGNFTTNQLRAIAAVRVTLTVQADALERAAPVTLRSTVGIPNLGISRVGL